MFWKQSIELLTRNIKLRKYNLYNNDRKLHLPVRNLKMKNNIVWIDMEMTGLDVQNDKILEIACLVTTEDLKIISPDFEMVIHQPDDILSKMDDWCTRTHNLSGLTDKVKNSKYTVKDAEEKLLEFLKTYTIEKTTPLAGNTVWMDRIFLKKYLPIVDEYLHYRIIDVSTIKELAKRWNSEIFEEAPSKKFHHRGLIDIKESIAELEYYKKSFFKV
ncbi:GSCOCG00010850001-RA-CDS [Cotesia congregata]|uniref:Probable oligoribonuclease n=1 Tax=Cotesia congregata TaxID=51543 RepID=A0A8J2H5X6_COTCN|nr:GSCOCG00010850001-RA-CDS [Cotesia congregata]CAG5077444.1 Similar to CG10214: Probable oligoribonuclease (Drosophila melanogaster) [Cotesia congregata]